MKFSVSDHQLVVDRLWLVAERVGNFLDIKGLRFDPQTGVQFKGRHTRERDKAYDLFSVGVLCLANILVKNPDCNNEYLRTCLDFEILHYWQTDRLIAIPPSTRRDRENRGDDPGDFTLHNLDPNGLIHYRA